MATLKSAHQDEVKEKNFGLFMEIEHWVGERCGGGDDLERYIAEWRIYEDGTVKYGSVAVSGEEQVDLENASTWEFRDKPSITAQVISFFVKHK